MMRKVELRSSLVGCTKAISRATDGMDERLLEAAVDLRAQAADMDIDDVGLRIEMKIPDAFEQHCPGLDLAGVAHQKFEEPVFPRLQVDGLSGARHDAGEQVDLEVADAQDRGDRLTGRPPRESGDAGDQLGEGEGFDQVVVGPGIEAVDAVVDSIQRGEEKHRRRDAGAADRLHDTDAVEPGQHAVDDHEVVGLASGVKESVAPVRRVLDDMPVLLQAADEISRGLPVVLDHQYLQQRLLARSASLSPSPADGQRILPRNRIKGIAERRPLRCSSSMAISSGTPKAPGSTRVDSTTGFGR